MKVVGLTPGSKVDDNLLVLQSSRTVISHVLVFFPASAHLHYLMVCDSAEEAVEPFWFSGKLELLAEFDISPEKKSTFQHGDAHKDHLHCKQQF